MHEFLHDSGICLIEAGRRAMKNQIHNIAAVWRK